jgi:4,4'-diaponeurosporenoate glycosyltransferase
MLNELAHLVCLASLGFLYRARLADAPEGRASPDRIDIVIPARDEAGSIGPLIASISAPPGTELDILVVDDASTDGTAEEAARAGARVLRVDGPPPGWTGKNWACHTGASTGQASLILFLDADVRLEPGALERIAYLYGRRGGLLSLMPRYAAASLPDQFALLFNLIGYQSIRRRESARGNALGAFGPCLTISRADYQALGGHAAVRGEVLEDMALALRAVRAGLPVTCYPGRGIVFYRMYPGWSALTEGFSKNFFAGLKRVRPLPAVLASAWIACLLAPLVFLAQAGGAADWGIRAVYLAAAAGLGRIVLERVGSPSWAAVLLQPLAALYFLAVFAISAYKSLALGRARWKGRVVKP